MWQVALHSWDFRWDVFGVLAVFSFFYNRGWWILRLRCHGRIPGLVSVWRFTSYNSGILILLLALLSPIDVLGGQLFWMHMVQHLLLMMFAPPLLLLANPMPVSIWGMPAGLKNWVVSGFRRKSRFRAGLRQLTPRGGVWMFAVVVFLAWHDPNAYNLALTHPWVHDLEHSMFFCSSMLYWWHVIGAGPRLHGRFPLAARFVYLAGMVPITVFAGVAIAFAKAPVYTYYTTVPRLWGVSVMTDQTIGGVIMWVGGGMMYFLAILILLAFSLRSAPAEQENLHLQPQSSRS